MSEMTSPAPLTLLTEEELDELADRVGKGPDEPLYDRCGEETTGRAEMHRLIESARLALTLQRRLDDALELIAEYQAQWGDDYLAKKWGLPERAAELRKQ